MAAAATSGWGSFTRHPKKHSLSDLLAAGDNDDDDERRDQRSGDAEDDDQRPPLTTLAPVQSFTALDTISMHSMTTSSRRPTENKKRRHEQPTTPTQPAARQRLASPARPPPPPQPPTTPLTLDDDDDGDGEHKTEEKKEAPDDGYIEWMRSSRDDIRRPGMMTASELKARSNALNDEDEDEGADLAFIDPVQFGVADGDDTPANRLQPQPIPNTGPPGIESLPVKARAIERASLLKHRYCFLCDYRRKMNDIIHHEQFGSSYHRLMVFIDENRHAMERSRFYMEVQRIYDNSCRKVLSSIDDRDHYWSLHSIFEHFECGHDTSYKNVLEVQFSWMLNLQMHYKNKAVCFTDTVTGRPVIDIKAAKEFANLSTKIVKLAALREACQSKA